MKQPQGPAMTEKYEAKNFLERFAHRALLLFVSLVPAPNNRSKLSRAGRLQENYCNFQQVGEEN